MTNNNDPDNLFLNAPGPAPWYTRKGVVHIDGFEWTDLSGRFPGHYKTALSGPDGVVLVLNMYNTVMKVNEESLLVWHQRAKYTDQISPDVHLYMISPPQMPSIESVLPEVLGRMDRNNSVIALARGYETSIRLHTDVVEEDMYAEFPDAMRVMDEVLILCSSSGAQNRKGAVVDLALMVVRPKESKYRLYPQDWFNSAGLDFGYQWVTRVVRHPRTGRIHGEGIRIPPFELNEDMCTLHEAWGTHPRSE